MKNLSLFALIISLCACTTNNSDCTNGVKDGNEAGVDCGGDCAPCPISYPDSSTHGANVLHGTDTLTIAGETYSFRANIPEGSSLKVNMTLIYGRPWSYNGASNNGWSISTYNNGKQTFEAINSGNVDVPFVWFGPQSDSGLIKVEYFENGNALSRTKFLMKEQN